MTPEMKEKYSELSNTNIKLQNTIDKMQQELDNIAREKSLLQQQISASSVSFILKV